ncbi:hypothetical protein ACPA9J_16135 [Pseudomonas aeruginosa]
MSTGLPLGPLVPEQTVLRAGRAGPVARGGGRGGGAPSRPLADLRDELCTLLMASHQSTGVTRPWSLLLLAQRPSCSRGYAPSWRE